MNGVNFLFFFPFNLLRKKLLLAIFERTDNVAKLVSIEFSKLFLEIKFFIEQK